MRYPDFLNVGGRIGFIAPSFACTTEPYASRFIEAEKLFRGLGYTTVKGPNCSRSDGIGKSSSAENCGREINEFFTEDRCDVIISCGGGETMCEDLPFVDFNSIKQARPKWYMGYSDNTNLVFTLPTLCDTAAIYGPNAAEFGMNPWHEAITDAFTLICGTNLRVSNYEGWEKQEKENAGPCDPYNITESFKITYSGASEDRADFSGRLIGGCLDILQVLCGTEYDKAREFAEKYSDDGIIWVLEACDLNPMAIRRALWQLDNAGWFKNVKGFLIGRPLHYDDNILGMDRINAVTGVLDKYGVPVLMDLDIGHLSPAMPLIMGSVAKVHSRGSRITIDMSLI